MSSALDRSHPPLAGPSRTSGFPHFERHRTARGLEILFLRCAELPLVGLQYVNRGGAHFDPGELRGLSSFTAALLEEGTELRSSTEIANGIEDRGGFLSTGCSWDGCSGSILLLREHTGFGLELLSEMVMRPAFRPEEIDRFRDLRLGELERRRTDPSALAAERFARVVYGDGVYGSPLIGDADSVRRIGRSDLAGFWAAHRQAQGSFLLISGDISPQSLLPEVEATLEQLPGDQTRVPPVGDESALERLEIHVADRAGAPQTELRIGHVGVPRNHPDRPALILLNSILGGKFTSRLNLNLREKHGYTYGVRSRFVDRIGRGPFLVSAAVETAAVAEAALETLGELRRLQEEPVPEAELEETKSYLLGVFPYTLQTLQGLHARLEELVVYELADDYFDTFPDRLRSVTVEQVQAAAQRHLDPDRAAIVAAGPAAELEPRLASLGPVEIHEIT